MVKLRSRTQTRAQQLRLKARQTVQQKRRQASGMRSEQLVSSSSVKQRLGNTPTRGRGRGTRGGGGVVSGRGRGRGIVAATGAGKIRILG